MFVSIKIQRHGEVRLDKITVPEPILQLRSFDAPLVSAREHVLACIVRVSRSVRGCTYSDGSKIKVQILRLRLDCAAYIYNSGCPTIVLGGLESGVKSIGKSHQLHQYKIAGELGRI